MKNTKFKKNSENFRKYKIIHKILRKIMKKYEKILNYISPVGIFKAKFQQKFLFYFITESKIKTFRVFCSSLSKSTGRINGNINSLVIFGRIQKTKTKNMINIA